jgi:integrase
MGAWPPSDGEIGARFENEAPMALTDTQIRQAKPTDKEYKLADGGGLYLLVKPNGSKLWKLKLRLQGREQKLSFGAYPQVSLKEARASRDEAKLEKTRGGDPVQRRRDDKLAAKLRAGNRFEEIAEELIAKREAEGLAPATLKKARWFLDLLKQGIGKRPIAEITPQELLPVLQKIERKGHRESAKRARSFASRVFRYAVVTGRCSTDPAHALLGALIAPVPKHYAAITEPLQLGVLLRAIDEYDGYLPTKCALRILPHVFVRPGELRLAQWEEFDFDKAEWLIPAGRMKARQPHRVPLSRQVVEMLNELGELRGRQGLVFASLHARGKPISENTMNQALRRLGYSGSEVTSHGFRSTASTRLNESGKWNADAIERALAHKDANAVRGIYHRGTHWEERVKMAQWWSDYLDGLKEGVAS